MINTPTTANSTCRILHQTSSNAPAARGFRPIYQSRARYERVAEPDTRVISQTASIDDELDQ
jgi:hypothetical protein